MPIETVRLFGITLHRVTMAEAIPLLVGWMKEDRPCRYVVTPNVDHVVMLQSQPEMRAAYEEAACRLEWNEFLSYLQRVQEFGA